MSVASLGMYDFEWLRPQTDAFWAALRTRLRARGLMGVPEALDRTRNLTAIWHDADLLLGQTCGYPLMVGLAGNVQVVATPCYDLPGCDGPLHRSFLVVRADDPARSLAELRGRRCAINGWDSNTGMNLARAAVAEIAGGKPFFGRILVTGAHLDSMAAVADGAADIAAVDCVTHGLVARGRPDLLRGLRTLAETASTPALPFVTAAATPESTLILLRETLAEVLPQPGLALSRVTVLDRDAYHVVVEREQAAARLGYPVLA